MTEDATQETIVRPIGSRLSTRSALLLRRIRRHAAFVGPGVIATVAYIDPGNWATDLQAGSEYGYSHLFVIVLATMIALLYQILSARLGIVTGLDLATHCRAALYDRPRHKMFYRWAIMYPLYGLSELGIILVDMAELLGSAIAINLLFPVIPLPAAIVLTSFDIVLILILFKDYPARALNRSMQVFEILIASLVFCVLGVFIAILFKVNPDWTVAFRGFIPSSGIVDNGAVFIAVGILGATVQPQAFYIGSQLATVQRIPVELYEPHLVEATMDLQLLRPEPSTSRTSSSSLVRRPSLLALDLALPVSSRLRHNRSPSSLRPNESSATVIHLGNDTPSTPSPKGSRSEATSAMGEKMSYKPSLTCVRAHLGHAQFDIAASLLGFAVVINSAILIVAASVFYYSNGGGNRGKVSDLFDAYDLVKTYIGPAFAIIFAVGLLASGQAASVVVTLSGQILSEGFIRWNTKPWKRRAVTRSIGIVPSLIVALAVGRNGIDQLLIISQVALSLILPFVIAPLILLTSDPAVMSVSIHPQLQLASSEYELEYTPPLSSTGDKVPRLSAVMKKVNPFQARIHAVGHVAFENPMAIIWLCWILWALIIVANMVALSQIAMGAQ